MLEFGTPHTNAQYRKSVGAIIFNPATKKILTLDWRVLPVHGIVQGGQDNGEDDVATLDREMTEETGYIDFEIQDKLGENIISHFYAFQKKVWRKIELACYLVILNSEKQIEAKLDEVESFDLVWMDIDDYITMVANHKPSIEHNFESLREFSIRAKKLLISKGYLNIKS